MIHKPKCSSVLLIGTVIASKYIERNKKGGSVFRNQFYDMEGIEYGEYY